MKRRKTGKRADSSPETVGLMGAGGGCGVTHTTILYANFLAAVEHRRVLVLDRSGTSSYGRLREFCCGSQAGGTGIFSVFGVDYQIPESERDLAHCLQTDYDVILLDFGKTEDGKKAEFLQCSCRMYLAALNEWSFPEFDSQLSWMKNGRKTFLFLSAFGGKEAREEIFRRVGLTFLWIPYEPDAFSPGPETITFFTCVRAGQQSLPKRS